MGMEIVRGYGRTACEMPGRREAGRPSADSGKTEAEKNAGYLKELDRKFPELNIEAGNFISSRNDRRITFNIDPALLERMQSDPEQEKETLELLKGAVQARKLIAALHKATGWEYEYSHDFIDANGKFWHTARSVRKDPINEEMRKKTREDTEKRIDEAVKKARIKRKELIEMIKSDTVDPAGTGEKPKNADTLELSGEAVKALEKQSAEKPAESAEETGEAGKSEDGRTKGSESEGRTSVAVNVGKRMRMIAAAETPDQVRVVLELLDGDLKDCKEGLEKGWCDEEEVKKVEALIELANKRMSEVAGNEGKETAGVGAFEMSMLF